MFAAARSNARSTITFDYDTIGILVTLNDGDWRNAVHGATRQGAAQIVLGGFAFPDQLLIHFTAPVAMRVFRVGGAEITGIKFLARRIAHRSDGAVLADADQQGIQLVGAVLVVALALATDTPFPTDPAVLVGGWAAASSNHSSFVIIHTVRPY